MTYSDLAEKAYLVTGASRGIGKTIAEELAKHKAHLILTSRQDETTQQELSSYLKDLGASNVNFLSGDLKNFEQIKSELDTLLKSGIQLEGLVNNAGISIDGLAMRVKEEHIEETFAVNLKATMLLTNHCLRYLMRAKNPSIILMSSVVGLMGNHAQTTYSASKAALIGYAKSLAKEMGSRKIRTNVVAPGFIQTEMTDSLSEEVQKKYLENIPQGEFGTTLDVANACLFLLSDKSKYINGEVIKVAGGLGL